MIDESLQIMTWATNYSLQNAREKNNALYQYLASPQNIPAEAGYSCAKPSIYALSSASPQRTLIEINDGNFKQALDGYKYPEKFTEKTCLAHRQQGEVFLQKLENLLSKNTYLLEASPCLADIAIFPFVRQFAAVDAVWWQEAPYPKLQNWLNEWLNSELFKSVMTKNPT